MGLWLNQIWSRFGTRFLSFRSMRTLLWLLAVIAIAPALHAQSTERPNVLFIAVDDLNNAVGFMSEEPGNPLQMLYPDPAVRARVRAVLTPNLDRLAAEGAPFAQTYAAAAICAPSRVALLTGVRPHVSEYVGGPPHRFNEVLADVATLPEYLRANGYYTAGVGKVFHNTSVDLNTDGTIAIDWPDTEKSWEMWFNRRNRINGATDWSPWSPGQGPSADEFNFGVSRVGFDRQTDYLNADVFAQALRTGTGTLYDEAYREDRTMALPQDRPFFLAIGLHRPHLPFVMAQEFLDLFDPDDIAFTDSLWQVLFEDTEDISEEAQEQLGFVDGELTAGPARMIFDQRGGAGPRQRQDDGVEGGRPPLPRERRAVGPRRRSPARRARGRTLCRQYHRRAVGRPWVPSR